MIAALHEMPAIADECCAWFSHVLQRECEAIAAVTERLSANERVIGQACSLLRACRGEAGGRKRVVVGGIGKAGLIGRKVAATLSSTGTPAVFVHPVEAMHGDLGGVCPGDCGLLLSYSGTTPEVVRLASELRRFGCPVIAITRSEGSELGTGADVVIELGEIAEACEHGLAPSSSTTAMLAIGDALALAVAKASGFSAKEFAVNHPAGMLGLRFRQVSEYMRTGSRLVCVAPEATVQEVVRVVSSAKTGAAILVDPAGGLEGIFTDGDLRRALLRGGSILDQPVREFASVPCSYVDANSSVAEAWKEMVDRRIEDLPVVAGDSRVVGLLCLKDVK